MVRFLKVFGFAALFLLCASVQGLAKGDVTVFAAASATNALNEIGKLYTAGGNGNTVFSFASSSTLAKQIENGAPADVFLSANIEWMDYLAEKDIIVEDSRKDILGNRIVFIVPKASTIKNVDITPELDLITLLGKDGRISVGDPAHVPVGTYSKAALEKLGLWDSVKDRIAPAKDVRAGLALVERAESPLGIVYASDAAISDKIRIIGTFPLESHPKIDYPVAIVKTGNVEAAKGFIDFMSSDAAKKIWANYGFEVK